MEIFLRHKKKNFPIDDGEKEERIKRGQNFSYRHSTDSKEMISKEKLIIECFDKFLCTFHRADGGTLLNAWMRHEEIKLFVWVSGFIFIAVLWTIFIKVWAMWRQRPKPVRMYHFLVK